jgi:hypothetical protein
MGHGKESKLLGLHYIWDLIIIRLTFEKMMKSWVEHKLNHLSLE